MKKSILAVCTVILSVSAVNAQWWGNEKIKGNGEMVTNNRSTPDYDKISLVGSMDVELVAGNEGEIKVEAESNLQEYILTEVKGGTLKISTEEGVSLQPSRRHSIKITVPFEDIEGVAITGSGDIWNSDKITARNFKTSVTGSGDLKLFVNTQNLKGSVTGSGDLTLKGTAQKFDCTVTGSGDFMAYDLNAEEVHATVSGSGDIEVNASEVLMARVSGSGDISYQGNPKKQDFKTSGSGSISSR